jgi:starvation-inducible DNA-binding protein
MRGASQAGASAAGALKKADTVPEAARARLGANFRRAASTENPAADSASIFKACKAGIIAPGSAPSGARLPEGSVPCKDVGAAPVFLEPFRETRVLADRGQVPKLPKTQPGSEERMQIDIGISEKDRKEIAEGLSKVLADTYSLYLKTHYFHWNVTGPMFQTLHLMFETQYNELALAVDLIAERIRALGFPAPGSYTEFGRLSSIPEEPGVPPAQDMIKKLVQGHETVVRTTRSMWSSADKAQDQPTLDLLTQRMQLHEKTAWMLRSLLA